jgi:hypothetical protein
VPALTKVNSKKHKKSEPKKISLAITIMGIVFALMLEAIGFLCFWKFYYRDIFYTEVVNENQDIGTEVPIATRDIARGESIDDAVKYVTAPSYMVVSNTPDSDFSELKASQDITANSIITKQNTYNPRLEDVVIDTSRQIRIDYLDINGAEEGDYIDIRLKVFSGDDSNTYEDKIVASKKCIISKSGDSDISLMLSEAEILNLNSAVVEAANGSGRSDGSTATLYTTKYIDPANQPKAEVTYIGKGTPYANSEVLESQQKLRDIRDGVGEYANPAVNISKSSSNSEELDESSDSSQDDSEDGDN